MAKNVLCLSRSYLSKLLPTLGDGIGVAEGNRELRFLHIVQSNAEERFVRGLGGEVVLNIERLVKDALSRPNVPEWQEPQDFRGVTGFPWSPVFADRHLVHYPPALRGKIAGILQAAVARIFSECRVDFFLSEPVALFITHLIYYYCRQHGARPLLWANTYFPGHFYFTEAMDISTPVRRSRADPAYAATIRQTVEQYARGVTSDTAGPPYHHSFAQTGRNLVRYWRQRRGDVPLILTPEFSTRAYQVFRLARAAAKRLMFPWGSDYMVAGSVEEHRFYLRCLMTPRSTYDEMPREFSESNVVFPLQYEPEASLTYFAPELVDQCSFIETVLRALPASRILWVKEHPNQFGALGERRWVRLRARYDNLRFIQGRESGRELIRKSALVVAISSTMGLDALLLGRRLLVCGRVFFADFTGAIRINSYADLAQQLNRADIFRLEDTFQANVEELCDFGRLCYPGDPQPSRILYSEDNLRKLWSGLAAECL